MFCKVYAAACLGIEGYVVQVEADLSNGLPSFRIVGEISNEIRESGERIRTAIRNSGYTLPPKRCVINLSPADFRKTGTGYDFPIAVALLCCVEQINPQYLEKSIFIGELGLNGNLIPVKGILSMISKAMEEGFDHCFVPAANAQEASIIPGINIYPIHSLREAVLHLQGIRSIIPEQGIVLESEGKEKTFPLDFGDIYGQETAKRCAAICVAGHHHLLMVGPPGSGKTMIAERIPYLFPDMNLNEQMMVTKIYSAAGRLKPGKGLMKERPFRRPHHTVSDKVLIGGGSFPTPGEISLAHSGVLFLDEFGEFSRSSIESLRQPLEAGEVFLYRVRGNCIYPAKPLLVAAMNPCRCGFYPDRERCMCTLHQVRQYMGKISGPMMERMDMCLSMHPVKSEDFLKKQEWTTSRMLYDKILKARAIQKERFKSMDIEFNSEMDAAMTALFCQTDDEIREFLEKVYERYHLSARTYQKVLKVARTIADLEGLETIGLEQFTEALCYRFPEERYGGQIWD